MRRRLPALAAALLLAGPAAARTRSVALTFDDLPYQAPAAQLCEPEAATAMTQAFVAMLAPLDMPATAFVNEGKVCEQHRAELLPALLTLWLDGGFDLGNHTFSHINIHRSTPEAYLAGWIVHDSPACTLLSRSRGAGVAVGG